MGAASEFDGHLSEDQLIDRAYQLVCGLETLHHEFTVCHRDLHGGNIMVYENKDGPGKHRYTFIDFGMVINCRGAENGYECDHGDLEYLTQYLWESITLLQHEDKLRSGLASHDLTNVKEIIEQVMDERAATATDHEGN